MKKSPFFFASVIVHLTILALITLKLNAEILKQLINKTNIIEVEMIKPAENKTTLISAIEYKDAIKEERKLFFSKNITPEKEDSLKPIKSEIKMNNSINTKSIIPEQRITNTNSKTASNSEKNSNDAKLDTKILYKINSSPDISINKEEKPKESINTKEDSSKVIKYASLGLTISNDNKTQQISDITSEQTFSQDYEIARRIIEEKANRFVPVIYQKKLLEKKKRTALVEMIINKNGYVNSHIIKKSTGLQNMDRSIRAILHLAEPYIYVPRPVNIELIFYE